MHTKKHIPFIKQREAFSNCDGEKMYDNVCPESWQSTHLILYIVFASFWNVIGLPRLKGVGVEFASKSHIGLGCVCSNDSFIDMLKLSINSFSVAHKSKEKHSWQVGSTVQGVIHNNTSH